MADKKAALLIQAPIASKPTTSVQNILQAPIASKPTTSVQSRLSSNVLGKRKVPLNPENYNNFSVKVQKHVNKRYSVMKFNTKVDVSKITTAHMQRQKNTFENKEDEMPKFGAGSEYGREQRMEARRKKRGYVKKGIKEEDLPWLLKTGGRGGKKYKGVKEKNISQNAAYYIFSQCEDGSFEAFPVDSLYRFAPVINYRTLTADEAEEEFSLRNKTINFFSLMVKKRLVDSETAERSQDEEIVVPKVKSKLDKLKLYNDDDLGDMSNEDGDEEEEHLDEEKFQKAKKKLGKTKKSGNEDDAGSDLEQMDDGYFDSKEVDYMSDTSSSDDEIKEKQSETKPQAEDDLNAQLNPDSEDDSELEDDKLSKGGLLLKDMLKQNDDSSGDDDEEEEIDEDETKSAVLLQGQKKKGKKAGSASSTSSSSRSDTPTKGLETTDKTIADAVKKLKDIGSPAPGKKRPKGSPADETPCKKPRKETESSSIHRSASGSSLASRAIIGDADTPGSRSPPVVGITEENVRKYLSHKPMTTKDLLKKFKTKKTGLTSEQTVKQIATILRRIQPEQNMVKGKLYLSLKS